MKLAEVEIERIAAGGDGIARLDELVAFIPRTAPGDRARVSLEVKKRFARGRLEEILMASPDRIEAPCAHYRVDRCGGCQVQHLRYDAQLEAKRGIIRDAVTRIGRRAVELPEIVRSDREWRYRVKLTLAMRRTAGGAWIIGLHPYDDPGAVFQLSDCPITDERVIAAWRQVMGASAHFPEADELRASVRLIDAGASVVMEGGSSWPARDDFRAAVPAAAELWWKPDGQPRVLVAARGESGDGAIGSAAGASFAQVNAGVGAALHAYVVARARAHDPRTLIDAYAGSGATAVALARAGIRVTAIEADRDASALCAAQLPAGSSAVTARVEDVLARAMPADVVLVNPPRSGVEERVASVLQSAVAAPRAIVYVSCDPATLARDLSRMPRYRIASIRAFDMFPQTAHVETVCELTPAEEQAA